MTRSAAAAELDVYEVAFLAGGVHWVVDTALVALVESGSVRVHAPGKLAAADPRPRHPVEAAVLDAVGTDGHRSVDRIRWDLTGDERLTDLGRSLAAAGLVRRRMLTGTWCPTRAGRATLRRLAASAPVGRAPGGGSALVLALRGREAMPDAMLRAALFERPAPPRTPEGGVAVPGDDTRMELGGAASEFSGGGSGDSSGF